MLYFIDGRGFTVQAFVVTPYVQELRYDRIEISTHYYKIRNSESDTSGYFVSSGCSGCSSNNNNNNNA